MRATLGRLAMLMAVTSFALACATSHRSSPFLKKGGGFIDVGGPAADVEPAVTQEVLARAAQEAADKRVAERKPELPTIEGRDGALRDALAALASAPSPAAHLRVANEYNRAGVRDRAYDHYSAALQLDPRNAKAFEGRARLLRDVGLPAMALTDAHRARFFAPSSAEVRNTLGTILERQGLCREALAAYRDAARLQPAASWAQQNVARLTDTCP